MAATKQSPITTMDGPEGPSASKIFLAPTTQGTVHLPGISPASTLAVERLLQENHDKFHIYFNERGYHNHISHHLLALYSLGATPEALKAAYEHNTGYQRPLPQPEKKVLVDLSDTAKWKEHLGKRERYADFLAFFTKEIETNGLEQTVSNWLFSGSNRAEDMFVRMFAGFVHPFIQLGYGVEFGIAPIVAEALAEAATHDNWIGEYLLPAERKAQGKAKENTVIQGDDHEDFVSLRFAVRNNSKLATAAEHSDENKLRGVMDRALKEMLEIGGRVQVPHDMLEEKMKESINLSAQICGGMLRPDKKIRFDFLLMHLVNSSIFLPAFIRQPWIPIDGKCRLVEWKVRYDLLLYASRRAPEIRLDLLENYESERSGKDGNPWLGIIERGINFKDDGHTIKLLRAILNGEEVSKGEVRDGMLTGNMWRKFANAAIDAVEEAQKEGMDIWIGNAGFDEDWEKIPDRLRN